MSKIFHIYANGDWVVENPHATGSDFGPGGHLIRAEFEKEFNERRKQNLDFFVARGAIVKDQRSAA
jgi:hypothetical protein